MHDGYARTGSGTVSGRTIARRGAAAPLQAPTRNRYFYGKLLDVYHLELEQRYFLEQRRMLNRLTVGYGVVCGLEVNGAADGKGVVVAPGFAVDGLGREIVVTEPILLADPSKLTDDCGRPAGDAKETAVTLCLAYHECETEPTPVLISDCDVREGCANGAVRERYALLVHDGEPDGPAYDPTDIIRVCRLVGLRAAELESGGKTVAAGELDTAKVIRVVPAYGAGPQKSGSATSAFPSCAPPDEDCVVLATVTLAVDETPVGIDAFTHRRIVLSNDRLFEAVVCLAATVERCCGQTKAASKITVVSGNGQKGKANAVLPKPITVEVTDADGNPLADAAVTFSVTSEQGGSFDPPDQKTAANGRARASWTLGAVGDQTAVARTSDGGLVELTATAKD